MLPVSALKDFHPLIVTPSHDGKYFHNFTISLINLMIDAPKRGLNADLMLSRGESLVQRARNNCVAHFLANPKFTHLVWIDSDIGFTSKAFYRILLADKPISAGIYPLKIENWPEEGVPEKMTKEEFVQHYTRYTVNTRKDENGEANLRLDDEGFFELSEAPTGFMAIKREVFVKMMEAYPERQYHPDTLGVEDNGLHYLFFDCFIDPESNRYLSEDYGFCWLWRQIGGSVFVDAHSTLTHQGTKLYEGDYFQTLVKNTNFAVGAPQGTRINVTQVANRKPEE